MLPFRLDGPEITFASRNDGARRCSALCMSVIKPPGFRTYIIRVRTIVFTGGDCVLYNRLSQRWWIGPTTRSWAGTKPGATRSGRKPTAGTARTVSGRCSIPIRTHRAPRGQPPWPSYGCKRLTPNRRQMTQPQELLAPRRRRRWQRHRRSRTRRWCWST